MENWPPANGVGTVNHLTVQNLKDRQESEPGAQGSQCLVSEACAVHQQVAQESGRFTVSRLLALRAEVRLSGSGTLAGPSINSLLGALLSGLWRNCPCPDLISMAPPNLYSGDHPWPVNQICWVSDGSLRS